MAAAALPSSFLNRVGIDPQGNVRLGVAEPLADCHDIHAGINQLAGVGMPQGLECHVGNSETGRVVTPIGADSVAGEWGAL